MIALAVLFGTVLAGAVVVGALAARALRHARTLSAEVDRATGAYQASTADLRERVNLSGTST